MSTTTLTLRHQAQLFTAKFWKRAPTVRRSSTHLFLRMRLLEICIMPIILYGARCMTWRYRDLRSIRTLQTELEYKVCNIRKKEGESSTVFGQRRTHLSRGAKVLVGTTNWEEAARREMHKCAGHDVRHTAHADTFFWKGAEWRHTCRQQQGGRSSRSKGVHQRHARAVQWEDALTTHYHGHRGSAHPRPITASDDRRALRTILVSPRLPNTVLAPWPSGACAFCRRNRRMEQRVHAFEIIAILCDLQKCVQFGHISFCRAHYADRWVR